jgi:hypothetical protein
MGYDNEKPEELYGYLPDGIYVLLTMLIATLSMQIRGMAPQVLIVLSYELLISCLYGGCSLLSYDGLFLGYALFPFWALLYLYCVLFVV